MKTGIFGVSALCLFGLAAAQPHRRHNDHHNLPKREVVTQTTYVTATAAEVVVFVDSNGKPVSTALPAPPTPAPAPPAPPVPPKPAAPPVNEAPKAPPKAPPAPAAPKPPPAPPVVAPAPLPPAPPAPPAPPVAPPAPEPAIGMEAGFIGTIPHPEPNPPSNVPGGFGISYSPYVRDAVTNAPRCKTTDEINSDFDTISGGGYSFARIYGTDCDQTAPVLRAAKARNMKIMTGVYKIQDTANELSKIIDAVKSTGNDWNSIITVGIGNEDVQFGRASVGEVVGAVRSARDSLRGAGYGGPVVHVDTVDATLQNPELCTVSDYAAVNCHAFFDPNVDAAQAGDFVQAQTERVRSACNGANVSVMESGWPHDGSPNGKAIPSRANQQIAVESLKKNFANRMMVLFSAFDDKWKVDRADTFNAEGSWGLWGQ